MKKQEYENLRRELHSAVMKQLDFDRDVSDKNIEELIDEVIVMANKEKSIEIECRKRLRKDIFHAIRKLDILQELIDNPSITEIMVNGKDNIFVEINGRITKIDGAVETDEKLGALVQQMVSGCNRIVNESNPIVDARLADGSRMNVVLYPVALNGPIVTIRRFPAQPITMKYLIRKNSISEEAANFLEKLVEAKYNIFISGGTGSGKTTFLNALSQYIPKEERIITIEDSAELQILDAPNLVRLETRNANTEGCREISIRDLLRTSLRMRPDRIILGEVRGGEAVDLMQCLNTGHDGSMSTGHGNSAKDMLDRLETMVLMGLNLPLEAIKKQIASGIDIIVHLGRLRDKSRRVIQIVEVLGYEKGEIVLNELYRFKEWEEQEKQKGKNTDAEETGIMGSLQKEGDIVHREKLILAGITL